VGATETNILNIRGRIWAIGGRDARSIARVDIYDPAGDLWQPRRVPSSPLHDPSRNPTTRR
jgi:Kelch motif